MDISNEVNVKKQLELMKVQQLKKILQTNGVSVNGRKDALIKRIITLNLFPQSPPPAPPAAVVTMEVDSNDSEKPKPEIDSPPPAATTPPPVVIDSNPSEAAQLEEENGNTINGTTTMDQKAKKRQATDKDVGVKSKRKKVAEPTPKTPLALLRETRPDATIEVLDSQGAGLPFTAVVHYGGQKYEATGQSKKLAKQNAAACALRSAVQFVKPHEILPIVNPLPPLAEIDFTRDTIETFEELYEKRVWETTVKTTQNGDKKSAVVAPPEKKVKKPKVTPDKNPIQLLHEMCGGLKYNCIEEKGKQNAQEFTMEVEVNGHTYQGFGKNKKQGKLGAAINALREEFKIVMTAPELQVVPSNADEDQDNTTHRKLPDLVYRMVREKFADLTDNMQSPNAKHKVVAGIVMTRENGPKVEKGEIISIATGTKCISGEYISNQGAALFDCHAEIISRRGLRKFLMDQLLRYSPSDDASIIEPLPGSKGGFRVKSNVFFHLYINTAPCGDARLFSPHEGQNSELTNDSHPNRKCRGQLRAKIEVGQGTIPIEEEACVPEKGRNNLQQTWDAVISGERLLTMSCSDKISKWNILGVQGSLLSIYVEPVYLSSIIVGSLFHSQHMQRGVYTRAKEAIDTVVKKENNGQAELPGPFTTRRPLLASRSNPKKRIAAKAPTLCLHWNCVDGKTSMVNASTGRLEDGNSSPLCKREVHQFFLKIAGNRQVRPRLPLNAAHTLNYNELKKKATDYQARKNKLMKGFTMTGCGNWVGKPSEVDQFGASAN